MTFFSLLPQRSSLKQLLPLLCCLLSLGSLSLLSGCADDAPPENFPSPNYDYLPQLNLNVSHIAITDRTEAGLDPKSLEAQDPTSPNSALALMAKQRLHATGNTGTGKFVITNVHFDQIDEQTISGSFAIKLTLNNNGHQGSITAKINHESSRKENETLRHHLFTLTQQMMDDMNVELEYQIRKNLDSWLTDATGMPLNSTIQTQSLAPLSSDPTATPQNTSASPLNAAPSSSSTLHSPQPGVLHLP